MFKKLLTAGLLLSLAAGNVLAANYKPYGQHKRHSHYKSRTLYKGENRPIYKGETTTVIKQTPDFVPCSTPTFVPGPYVGMDPGIISNYNRTSSVYKGLQGTLFGGYAMLNDSFYLAAEIFAQHNLQIQNYRNDFNVNGNPIGVKSTWGFGLSVLPGFLVADTLMAYLRIGAVRTHFQDIAQTATGGQAGLGLEGTVSENWNLRAEYIYTFYQSMTGLGAPRSDTFRFGVLYRFWG